MSNLSLQLQIDRLPPPLSDMPAERLTQLKAAFAVQIMKRPSAGYTIGLELLGQHNSAAALYISQQWPSDPYVQERVAELYAADGAEAGMMTKADFCRTVIEAQARAAQRGNSAAEVSCLTLYATVRGWTGNKSGGGVTVTATDNAKVVVIERAAPSGDDDAWERACLQQQERVINEAKEVSLDQPAAVTVS